MTYVGRVKYLLDLEKEKFNLSDTDEVPKEVLDDILRNESILYTISLKIEEAYFEKKIYKDFSSLALQKVNELELAEDYNEHFTYL